jgi:flavin-binding protein dodecin
MSESVYKVIELVGTSETSWADAAKNAVETAGKSLRNLRIADVSRMDMRVENGKITQYRVRVSQSFKVDSKQLAASVNKLMGSYP